ncbi:hypothetical protein NW765_006603 [Fusarium oxysporum]|nr:hypothetical protein NW765_006603 [Fusarium oxysporum]
MKQSFVLPPHVEDVRRCLTDFSCLSNEKDESFHIISKDIEEGMERDLNPDPIRKAAERIQHEVLSRVGGGYAENVWQDIFGKRLFDQLTDSPSLSRDDSRRSESAATGPSLGFSTCGAFTWSALQALKKFGLEPSPFAYSRGLHWRPTSDVILGL